MFWEFGNKIKWPHSEQLEKNKGQGGLKKARTFSYNLLQKHKLLLGFICIVIFRNISYNQVLRNIYFFK